MFVTFSTENNPELLYQPEITPLWKQTIILHVFSTTSLLTTFQFSRNAWNQLL